MNETVGRFVIDNLQRIKNTENENPQEYRQISLRAEMMLMIETWFCQDSSCIVRSRFPCNFADGVRIVNSMFWKIHAVDNVNIECATSRLHGKKLATNWHRHNLQLCKTFADATFCFERFPFYLSRSYQYQTFALHRQNQQTPHPSIPQRQPHPFSRALFS